jgi:hypothetical protein
MNLFKKLFGKAANEASITISVNAPVEFTDIALVADTITQPIEIKNALRLLDSNNKPYELNSREAELFVREILMENSLKPKTNVGASLNAARMDGSLDCDKIGNRWHYNRADLAQWANEHYLNGAGRTSKDLSHADVKRLAKLESKMALSDVKPFTAQDLVSRGYNVSVVASGDKKTKELHGRLNLSQIEKKGYQLVISKR